MTHFFLPLIADYVSFQNTQITDARDQDRLLFDSDDLETSKAYLIAHHTLAIFCKDVSTNEKTIREALGLAKSDLQKFQEHWYLDILQTECIEARQLKKSLRIAKSRIEVCFARDYERARLLTTTKYEFHQLRQRRDRAIQLQKEIQRLFSSVSPQRHPCCQF